MRSLFLSGIVVALLTCSSLARAADVREGLWEISLRTEMNGQPASDAPMVMRQCVNKQSVQEMMTKIGGGGGGCNVSDFKQEGERAHWNIACTGQMDITGTGETRMGNNEFDGRMDLKVNMGTTSMPMAQVFKGRRVGECQ